MESGKVKYIDLGLPSGILWSDKQVINIYNRMEDFNCGLVPTDCDINELYCHCIIDADSFIGLNGNRLPKSGCLYFNRIKYK